MQELFDGRTRAPHLGLEGQQRTRRGTPSGLAVPATVGAFAPLKGGEGEHADGDGDGKTGGDAGELHRGDIPRNYSPLNTGFRFSANAASASSRSCVGITRS